MQNVSVYSPVSTTFAAGEYVPEVAYINGRKADVVFRTQLGPVEIVGAERQGSFLRIQLSGGEIYKCKAEVFGGTEFPREFLQAIESAYINGIKVELAVAVQAGRDHRGRPFRAAQDYFCGLREPMGRTTRDLSGTCNL